VVVVVNAIEDATITSPLTYCDNDSPVTLTSVTPGGTWSATCGTCVNGGTGLFDPVTATAGSYSITYTTSGTCPGTDVQTITVNPYQDATITPAGPFCSGDSPVTLTAATSGGTWTGTGITNSATGVFDPAVAGAGAHSITYTISGACGSTDMVTVTVDLQDDATITSAGPFCDNDAPVTLSAPTAGGTWSATCGTCINGVTGVFDPAAAGGGSYTITYITSGTCPSTDNEIISVNPFLDPTITAAGPFCPNDAAVNLSAASVGGTWSGTGITAPILGTFDPVVAGPGSHTISHTTSGSCGGTDTEVIVVTSPDVVDAGSDASICEGGTYSLLGSFTPSGATGVIWSTSGTGVISTPTSLTPVYTSGLGETGTIWMAVTTTGGTCPAVSDTMQLTISAIEDASFSIANFCEGSLESALITGTPGGTFSFAITPSMGETINPSNGEISGAMGGNIYSVQYATPGVCQDIDTVSITVYSIPGMTVSTTNPTCWNTTDGSIFISAMGSGPFDFSIDNGTSTSNAASTFTFNGLTGGSYSPWVMDANGCVISSTETLNTPATVSFTAVVTDISCNGAADGSIEVTAAGGSGADYHVSFDGGTTFVTIASAGTVDTLSPAAAGTYNIVVTDVNGCSSDTNSYVVAEPAALVISGITTGSDTCGLGTGTIAFSVSGGNSPYGYSLNGGAVQFTPLFTGVAAGTYIIGVGDIDGCIETQMVSVNSATADLSNMINATVSAVAVCPGSEVLLNASSGFDTYSWTGSNISNTIIPNPSAIPDLALNMYIIDVTAGSCTGSDTLYVITADSLCTVSTNVTNAFSPDDDGVNDTWFVEAVAASPNNKVFIYNRWGDVLREFTNYDNQSVVWDGKSASGVVLPTGTYYYIIELQDTSERLSGWVYITK
jgi:gliding motility-associated-like protein